MNSPIKYRIDPQDTVVFVNDQWDNFAIDNGASKLSEKTVGKPIWNFLSTDEVKQLYKRLFDAVRHTNKPTLLHFRCDSEAVLRFMTMAIESKGDGFLDIETRLLREVPRKVALSREVFFLGINNGRPMCSHCNKIFVHAQNRWMEIDEALMTKAIKPELSVSYTICDDCKKAIKNKTQRLIQ